MALFSFALGVLLAPLASLGLVHLCVRSTLQSRLTEERSWSLVFLFLVQRLVPESVCACVCLCKLITFYQTHVSFDEMPFSHHTCSHFSSTEAQL
uniref:Putative secreted protein n=1 Tax=Amblyomma cajennense TaxID=34607 RepID=A0A023FBH8_AMBCJ